MPDTYPSEVDLVEAAALALGGETDEATGLTHIGTGTDASDTPSLELMMRRREQRLHAILAVANQGRVVDEGGLNIGAYPFDAMLGTTAVHFAGATGQACSDDASNYVYVDSTGVLQIVTAATGWPTAEAFWPLAMVTCAGGDITAMADVRGRSIHTQPAEIDGLALAEISLNGGVPVVFEVDLPAESGAAGIHSANAPFAYDVIDAWSVSANTSTGGAWWVTNGSDTIISSVSMGTTGTVNRAASIDRTYNSIAAAGTLQVATGGMSGGGRLYVMAVCT